MSASVAGPRRAALQFQDLDPRNSPDLVYFSSVSENTRRFVERLDREAVRIPLRPSVDGMIRVARPYVLVLPTYGGGERSGAVPKQVVHFLNDTVNRSLIRGVITRAAPISGSTTALPGPSSPRSAACRSCTASSCSARTGTSPGSPRDCASSGPRSHPHPPTGRTPREHHRTTPDSTARTPGIGERQDHHALNAQLNLFAPDGSIQFEKDREAVAAYLSQHVAPRRRHFDSVWDRLERLIRHEYYEEDFLRAYEPDFVVRLHERVSRTGHRFQTFLGAFTFYTS